MKFPVLLFNHSSLVMTARANYWTLLRVPVSLSSDLRSINVNEKCDINREYSINISLSLISHWWKFLSLLVKKILYIIVWKLKISYVWVLNSKMFFLYCNPLIRFQYTWNNLPWYELAVLHIAWWRNYMYIGKNCR